MSGGHVLNEELIKKGILRIEQAENGLFDVHWYGGVDTKKSFFPAGWSKEKAVREVAKSIKKRADLGVELKNIVGEGWKIPTISDKGLEILTVIGENGRFKTAYPFSLE